MIWKYRPSVTPTGTLEHQTNQYKGKHFYYVTNSEWSNVMKTKMLMIMIILTILTLVGSVKADALSIYEIQYTTDANGIGPQNSNVVDCLGGIVTHKRGGGRPRLFLQDPNYPDGWGAIQVKGWSFGAFDDVAIGDLVSLANVQVDDFKGTTFLQYKSEYDPNFTIVSTNNPLPRPLVVTIDEIAAPLEDLDAWIVPDHNAEKYEAMLIKVINVYVKDVGYGKAYDNYLLASNVDPNLTCWASDYMNSDRVEIYHPYIDIGQNFCGVTGVLEQYTGDSEGVYYDYYQLLTTSTKTFTIDQTADFDGDCDVDLADFSIFAEHWLQTGCSEPDWCGGADLTKDQSDGIVDTFDLLKFAQLWLEGR